MYYDNDGNEIDFAKIMNAEVRSAFLDDLWSRLENYVTERHKVDPKFPPHVSYVDQIGGSIHFTCKEHRCSCCSPDTSRGYVDVDDLYDETEAWKTEAMKRVEAEKVKTEQETIARVAKQKADAEATEKALFASLKAKYEAPKS